MRNRKRIIAIFLLADIALILAILLVTFIVREVTTKYTLTATYYTSDGVDDRDSRNESVLFGKDENGKALEAIKLEFENKTDLEGSIEYRVRIMGAGWSSWTPEGELAGVSGGNYFIEAVEFRLVGEIADEYSVAYRTFSPNYEWRQDWRFDGTVAGTIDEDEPLWAIEIKLVEKDGRNSGMNISYRVNQQLDGWKNKWMTSGTASGSVDGSQSIEAISLALVGTEYSGDISYTTFNYEDGWSEPSLNGEISGAIGEGKSLEAISVNLEGEISDYYDVYYRTRVRINGWLGWSKNGEKNGIVGYSKRIEAIQVVLVKKGANSPGAKFQNESSGTETAYLENKKDITQITTKVTAHRGASMYAPQNTMISFRQAVYDFADVIEMDVRLTKDGKLIVSHDDSLEAAASNNAKISQSTYDFVRSLNASYGMTKEHVTMPNFEETVAFAKEEGIPLNVEFKVTSLKEDYMENFVHEVLAVTEAYDYTSHCVFACNQPEMVQMIKTLYPEVTTVFVVTQMDEYGMLPVSDYADVYSINQRYLNAEMVEVLHSNNKAVYAWTLDDKDSITEMLNIGVDNVITDDPYMAKQVLYEY